MSERETIHLAADISFIHTDYLWRMPGSWVGYPYYSSSEFYEDIARMTKVSVSTVNRIVRRLKELTGL